MKKYKRLLQHRIRWTEQAQSRVGGDDEMDGEDNGEQTPASGPSTLKVDEGEGNEYGTASLENNRCDLVWEGQIRERTFKGLRLKKCPTDAMAKEALGSKMAGFWDQTKNWKSDEVELF